MSASADELSSGKSERRKRGERILYWLLVACVGILLGLSIAIVFTMASGSSAPVSLGGYQTEQGVVGGPIHAVGAEVVADASAANNSCDPTPPIVFGSHAGWPGGSSGPEMLGPCGQEVHAP